MCLSICIGKAFLIRHYEIAHFPNFPVALPISVFNSPIWIFSEFTGYLTLKRICKNLLDAGSKNNKSLRRQHLFSTLFIGQKYPCFTVCPGSVNISDFFWKQWKGVFFGQWMQRLVVFGTRLRNQHVVLGIKGNFSTRIRPNNKLFVRTYASTRNKTSCKWEKHHCCMSKLHKYSTQPAAHSQDTNTGRSTREDGDCERRRDDGDLPFPKLKSLCYYWPLMILIYLTEYLSNNKRGKLGMGTWVTFPGTLVICVITGTSSYPGNTPSILDYTKYCIIIACTVTVQLPMRVLHGMCYSYTSGGDDQSPTHPVVMISHLT